MIFVLSRNRTTFPVDFSLKVIFSASGAPRYVDTFEKEESVDLGAVSEELKQIDEDMKDIDEKIQGFCEELGIDAPT